MTTAQTRGSVHPLANLALAVSIVAGGLALYGSLMAEYHLAGSPLNVARNRPGLPETQESPALRYSLMTAAFILPLVLGIAAALLGGEGMKAIERSAGGYSGNVPAVFAIMIGGLAAIVAGCMCFAIFLWPHMPALEPG